jgi:hypothetical protein
VADDTKKRMKYPEPTGGIIEDPTRPDIFLWTYELPGPMGIPCHADNGEAPDSGKARLAWDAAHAEGRRKWREYVISRGFLPDDE